MLLSPLSGYEPISSLTHPSAAARVTLVRELLGSRVVDEFQTTLTSYADYRTWVVTNRVAAQNKAFDEWMDLDVLPHIRAAAIQVVGDLKLSLFGGAEVERAKRLANRVARGIPPSAIRWASKASIRTLLDEALSKQAGSDEAFAESLSYLGERAATPVRSLSRGTCIVSRSTLMLSMMRSASGTAVPHGRKCHALAAIFKSDRLLSAAVDTTNVHMRLVQDANITGELLPLNTLPDSRTGSPVPHHRADGHRYWET